MVQGEAELMSTSNTLVETMPPVTMTAHWGRESIFAQHNCGKVSPAARLTSLFRLSVTAGTAGSEAGSVIATKNENAGGPALAKGAVTPGSGRERESGQV